MMKIILFVVFVGNFGGTSVERIQYYNEEKCLEASKTLNEQYIKYGSVTAFCVQNNDLFK
jgi:hypothetical protein